MHDACGAQSEDQRRQMNKRLLITGGTGFVGSALAARARKCGFDVRVSSRRTPSPENRDTVFQTAELDGTTDWMPALSGVDVVVHCAARVHLLNDRVRDPLQAFRIANRDATLHLARQARIAGVRRFVFISSIGVNGAETLAKPFCEQDAPAPHSPYAVSKHEAEIGLMALARESGLEVVIIRPPLIYGPRAPGNFGKLMRAIEGHKHLPLGSIFNQRSLVGRDNLTDFILLCAEHPKAANETFLISDGVDISTTELLKRMAHAVSVPARLWRVPVSLLVLAGSVFGKREAIRSLTGNLQLDISKACDLLGWEPPVGIDEGLRRIHDDQSQERRTKNQRSL
jgi:nucleoside-diphosphate-sugar epimerase